MVIDVLVKAISSEEQLDEISATFLAFGKDFFSSKFVLKHFSFLLGSSFCFTFVFITDGTLGCSDVIFSLSAFYETFKEKKKKLRLGNNKRKGND